MKLTIEDFALIVSVCKAHGLFYNDLDTEKKCALQLRMIKLRLDKRRAQEFFADQVVQLDKAAIYDLRAILSDGE